jgi:hypothetical protein
MHFFPSSTPFLPRLVLYVAILGIAGMALPGDAQTAGAGTPVLVELFTSEGCSDCPPADALLERLDKEQSIAGMHAIVLSEHVTYWDRQGWRDPFSMDEMTERQQVYSARFGLKDVYTPQMVVDGTVQFVGSNAQALLGALQAASERPKQQLSIETARWDHSAVEFSVRGAVSPGERLVGVLAADATHTEVTRGENAGRTLHHVAVVRAIKDFKGDAMDGRPLKLESGSLPDGQMRLVVFTVDAKSWHVLGAAEQTLMR